ncbi:MAG: hypothetical protein ACMG6S_27180 [Byssovorax sp.]
MKTLVTRVPVGLCALVLLAACGGEPAPVAPPAPTEAPAVAPAPTVTAEATPPAPSAAPSGSAKTDMPVAPKGSSGRTAVLMSDAIELNGTFGSGQGAKLELGENEKMTLKIPENAFGKGTTLNFKIDAKGKAGGGLIGKILHLTLSVPPETVPATVTTEGDPFELQMPAGSKKNANLAVGTVTVDDKGREKIVWKVISPKRIDDAIGVAYFDLPTLSESFLHVTTKAPSK